ncbi:ATP-binding protein [Streptomyces sp. IB2014 016-6]|uniref:ATP-binding protein n=1 Tax=Streptomyces sp. IB2014 016-6 TaxID=2517818 RepID=UPI0011CAB9CA|nr:ATP-binding protein [Streptomyces sp. IB2014 016-6]TXL88398.1 ATP-binding protein [Streptomyces sp. IB2014 016-6]
MDQRVEETKDRRTGPGTGRVVRRGAVFSGDSEMIGEARRFAADFLGTARTEQGAKVPSRVIGTAQLVVSELVTNACKYAPGPCLLDLVFDGDVVEITVWDTDSTLPVPRAAEPGRIGQHGMEIVIALCEGYDVRREPVGKRIKVRLAASDDGRA